MARRINPFLVDSGLTKQQADLTGLFVPTYTQKVADGGVVMTEPAAASPSETVARGSGDRRAVGGRPAVATRGKRQHQLLGIRAPLAGRWRLALGIAGVSLVFVIWLVAAARGNNTSVLVPTPAATWRALADMWSSGQLRTDLWASAQRVGIGYGISVAIGIVVGILIGSFASVESFLEPPIGFLRYIPATALLPLFLLWLGLGESPKIWLIVVGTVFYNILMIADVARTVPRQLLQRVVHARRRPPDDPAPGDLPPLAARDHRRRPHQPRRRLVDARRGRAARRPTRASRTEINRAQRFRAVDEMFALLIVFGVIGLVSDLFLRWLRDRVVAMGEGIEGTTRRWRR